MKNSFVSSSPPKLRHNVTKGDRTCKHFVLSFTQSEGTWVLLLTHAPYVVKVDLNILKLLTCCLSYALEMSNSDSESQHYYATIFNDLSTM